MSVKPFSILILGGTAFLGRHLTEVALARGHRVTLFNRGKTHPELFPQVERLQGDRLTDLTALADAIAQGRRWDAVIDVAGYVPRVVQESATLLESAVDHYTFISSISVYADFKNVGMDETGPLGQISEEAVLRVKTNSDINGENYGPLKALCEEEVLQLYGERSLVVRPGLIVGPHDPTDRFTYWPHRVAQGGRVLAPDRPEHGTQVIDVRDLAEWTLRMIEAKASGIYNATGPDYTLTLGAILQECSAASQALGLPEATVHWVDERFLLDEGVQPWSDLPLWIPSSDPDSVGFDAVNCEKAIAQGLHFRPIGETVRDTLAWDRTREGHTFKAGLSQAREAELLAKFLGEKTDAADGAEVTGLTQ